MSTARPPIPPPSHNEPEPLAVPLGPAALDVLPRLAEATAR